MPILARVVTEPLTKKNRAGGSRAGDIRSAPFGSKVGQGQDIDSRRARPRWLTERIALVSLAHEDLIQKTKTQVRVGTRRAFEELRQKTGLKKSDNNVFFRLIRALMADPFSLPVRLSDTTLRSMIRIQSRAKSALSLHLFAAFPDFCNRSLI